MSAISRRSSRRDSVGRRRRGAFVVIAFPASDSADSAGMIEGLVWNGVIIIIFVFCVT